MKVVSMNEETRRREQFENIMANARPMMIEGKGKNMKVITACANVPLSLCYVDPRYQCMRVHKYLSRLEANWDVRKLSNITLVPHPEEYRFAITDGQGRYLTAPKKGMDRLYATILMDAPEDPEERLKFEAEAFIGQDSEIERVKDLEKHPARVIIGDEAATTLEKLLKKYKIHFTGKKGQRSGSVLGSYTDTYAIAKVHGEKCLDFIFSIIENAGWNTEPNGYATFVMRSLREIWYNYPNERKDIHTFLSTELRQMKPSLFVAKARAMYPSQDNRTSSKLYLEDIVCKNLGLPKRIYSDEKKYKVVK